MGRLVFVSFGLLVVFLSLSGTGADCPSDWSSYEGHCYRVFQQEMTWEAAEKFCTQQHQKSHPVYFRSSEEERRLQWSDGTKVNYKAWSAEPECVVCRASHREWLKVDCRQQHSFMCKFTRPR